MKKLLLVIGLLIVPSIAYGQDQPTALSPWVQKVLERVDEGISFAQSLPAGTCDDESAQNIVRANRDIIRQLVIPSLEREVQSESLRERTLCVENDRRLLQIKIRAVQDAMDEAARTCNRAAASMLRENYAFIFRAYSTFITGAVDPTVQDNLLRYKYAFHDQELYDAGIDSPVLMTGSSLPVCPYTTDYAVHSLATNPLTSQLASFGCDISVLSNITVVPLDQEAAKQKEFMEKTQDLSVHLYYTVMRALQTLNSITNAIVGAEPTEGEDFTTPESFTIYVTYPDGHTEAVVIGGEPQHVALQGCLRPEEVWLPGNPKGAESVLSAYPDYYESYNLRTPEWEGATPTYGPTEPGEVLPDGVRHLPVNDYFLIQPSAAITARSYADKRERFGEERPLPPELVSQMFDSLLSSLFRGSDTAASLVTISGNIEREMAIYDMSGRDSMQKMKAAAAPLEEAVNSLIDVTEEFLPKEYTPDIALFLARSCVDGHCQRTLDAVAQRTFNPFCHPYVSGKYMDEKAAKKCFCDPEIESEDRGFWDQYCSNDWGQDAAKYDNMQPELVPACVEEVPITPGSWRNPR